MPHDARLGALVLLAPALFAFEVALLAAAARGGWLRAKLRAQAAVVRELPQIFARRQRVQAIRRSSVDEFVAALVATLDSPVLEGGARVPGVELSLRGYFRLVRILLRCT